MSVPARLFSTATLPAARTLEAWRDYMAEVYYTVDVKPRDSEHVRGELREVTLGRIGLSSFKAGEQRVFRSARAAKLDRSDHFVLIFPLRRKLYFQQRGRSGFIDPGSVVVLRSSEDYEASCPDGFENVTVKVPAEMLTSRLACADDACAREGAGSPLLAGLVSSMAGGLILGADQLDAQSTDRLERSLADLVALMLERPGGEGREVERLPMRRRFAHVCDFARRHLADEALSPASVAGSLGISVSYLHKLFQRQGTTFGRWLLEARLEAAQRMIQSRTHVGSSLGEIALACGFVSQSHFSTQYRGRFGESPRETRHRAGG